MPLGSTYSVTTKYRVDEGQAARGVRNLANETEKLDDKAERARGRVSGMFKAFVGTAAVSAAGFLAGILGRNMIRLGQQAESARIAMAGVFSTLSRDGGTFADHMERADRMMERFGKRSITSPATRDDFRTIFNATAAPLVSMGLGDQEIEDFVAQSVPAALAFTGGDYQQAGGDIARMLQGQAGADNRTFTPIRGRMLEETGTANIQEFNQLAQQDPRQIMEALNKVLAGMDDVNKAYGDSVTGLFASLSEQSNQFLRNIYTGFESGLKPLLQTAVGWLGDNENAVESMAEKIGETLGNAVTKVANLAAFAARNFEWMAAAAVMAAAPQALAAGKAGVDMVSNLRTSSLAVGAGRYVAEAKAKGSTLRNPVSVIGDLMGFGDFGKDNMLGNSNTAAARTGRTGRGVIGKLGSFVGLGGGAAASGGATAAAGGAAASGGGLAAMFGSFAAAAGSLAVILIPLVVIIGMVAGTFRRLRDSTDQTTQFFRRQIDWLFAELDGLAAMFGGSGEGFGGQLKKFADWLGTGVVGVLGIVIGAFAGLVSALSYVAAFVQGIAATFADMFMTVEENGIRSLFTRDGFAGAFERGMGGAFADRSETAEQRRMARQASRLEREAQKNAEQSNEEEGQGERDIVANITVNQEITTDGDPDRIALRTGEVVGDGLRDFRRSIDRGL